MDWFTLSPGSEVIYIRGLVSYFFKKKGGAMNPKRRISFYVGVLSILANIGIFSYHFYKIKTNRAWFANFNASNIATFMLYIKI
jgi:hypothetical protein